MNLVLSIADRLATGCGLAALSMERLRREAGVALADGASERKSYRCEELDPSE